MAAAIDIIQTQVSATANSVVPDAGAILNIRIRPHELIKRPLVELIFDKPILKAVPHAPNNEAFYANYLYAQGGKLVRFSFDGRPFDSAHAVEFTVYSVETVRLQTADVKSLEPMAVPAGVPVSPEPGDIPQQ